MEYEVRDIRQDEWPLLEDFQLRKYGFDLREGF